MPGVQDLDELQLAIMNFLWTRKQASAKETLEALSQDQRISYRAVRAALQSLEKRGFATRDPLPGTRKILYRPLTSPHDAISDILQDVLGRLFAGSPATLVKYLIQTEGFSLEELREIRLAAERQEGAALKNRNAQPSDIERKI